MQNVEVGGAIGELGANLFFSRTHFFPSLNSNQQTEKLVKRVPSANLIRVVDGFLPFFFPLYRQIGPCFHPCFSHFRTQLRMIGLKFGRCFGIAYNNGIDGTCYYTEQNATKDKADDTTNPTQWNHSFHKKESVDRTKQTQKHAKEEVLSTNCNSFLFLPNTIPKSETTKQPSLTRIQYWSLSPWMPTDRDPQS